MKIDKQAAFALVLIIFHQNVYSALSLKMEREQSIVEDVLHKFMEKRKNPLIKGIKSIIPRLKGKFSICGLSRTRKLNLCHQCLLDNEQFDADESSADYDCKPQGFQYESFYDAQRDNPSISMYRCPNLVRLEAGNGQIVTEDRKILVSRVSFGIEAAMAYVRTYKDGPVFPRRYLYEITKTDLDTAPAIRALHTPTYSQETFSYSGSSSPGSNDDDSTRLLSHGQLRSATHPRAEASGGDASQKLYKHRRVQSTTAASRRDSTTRLTFDKHKDRPNFFATENTGNEDAAPDQARRGRSLDEITFERADERPRGNDEAQTAAGKLSTFETADDDSTLDFSPRGAAFYATQSDAHSTRFDDVLTATRDVPALMSPRRPPDHESTSRETTLTSTVDQDKSTDQISTDDNPKESKTAEFEDRSLKSRQEGSSQIGEISFRTLSDTKI